MKLLWSSRSLYVMVEFHAVRDRIEKLPSIVPHSTYWCTSIRDWFRVWAFWLVFLDMLLLNPLPIKNIIILCTENLYKCAITGIRTTCLVWLKEKKISLISWSTFLALYTLHSRYSDEYLWAKSLIPDNRHFSPDKINSDK